MAELLRNRAKPIKGAIASAIVYLLARVGVDLDPAIATTIAGVVFAIVVERVPPVFGEPKISSPRVIEVDGVRRRL